MGDITEKDQFIGFEQEVGIDDPFGRCVEILNILYTWEHGVASIE